MKTISIEEIERRADKLSSFDGDDPFIYTGENDPLLQFGGSIQNFAGEGSLDKKFKFTVANAAAATRTAVLWPGYLKGNGTLAPGQLADGAFNDKSGNAGLTGSTDSLKTIAELWAFLDKVPTRLLAIGVRSDTESQLAKNMTVKQKSPFNDDKTFQIAPSDFQDQNIQQTKILQFVLPEGYQLDFQTYLELPFVASSSTTLTFYFGASLNIANALAVKAMAANQQISAFGGGKSAVINRSVKNSVRQIGM